VVASIQFAKVSFAYRRSTPIFDNFTLRLDGDVTEGRGRIIAVMGPSGSGKTTLLRLVAGVEIPLLGEVELDPVGASVSYLQQEPVLFEHLSRYDNARYFKLVENVRARFEEQTFYRLNDKLKLSEILRTTASVEEMSGGERQRLSLLRALSIRPRILLLDEPCTGLDVDVKLEFLHMLREVIDDFGLLALYVTHHSDEADLVADDLLYLKTRGPSLGVATSLLAMSEVRVRPPSIEAAQAFMNPGGNTLACLIMDSGMVVTEGGSLVGRCRSPHPSPGSYRLAFAPECVVWTSEGGQVVEVVGQSAHFWFVRVGEKDKVVGLKRRSAPISFVLSGEAFAFSSEGGDGFLIWIGADVGEDPQEGSHQPEAKLSVRQEAEDKGALL